MSRLSAGWDKRVRAARAPAISRRRLAAVGCVAAAVLAMACGCSGTPSPVGDPDPGGRALAALTQVLSLIPAGSQISYESRTEPIWNSCDGRKSTYGWSPAAVSARFSTGAASEQQVLARARATMAGHGWTYSPGVSGHGQWLWHRQVAGGAAVATLQYGAQGTPRSWSLDAQAPPAVHPVTGC